MKALSLVLRIVAALSAIAAIVLFFIGKDKLKETTDELNSTKQTLTSTRNNLDEANARIDVLTTDLEDTRTQLANTEAALQEASNSLVLTQDTLRETQAELEQTSANLSEKTREAAQYRQDLVNAQSRLAQSVPPEEAEEMRMRIAQLDQLNRELTLDLNAEKARYERLAVETGRKLPESQEGTPALQEGMLGKEVRLAAVDKARGIVVIEGGTDAGLLKGTEVTLVKDLSAVARVKVAEVNGGLMVAGVLPGTETDELNAGITVNVLP